MSGRIISRPFDLRRIEDSGQWKMIYGRRKTGKSFIVKNFLKYDKFFFVNRDSSVIDEQENAYTYNEFFAIFKELFGEKTIAIDEFHRLPPGFQDFLHSAGVSGKLILITSTLWLANELLGKGSPLIGLVSPIRISQIDEADILKALSPELSGKNIIEAATYLREPSLIPQFNAKEMADFMTGYLSGNKFFIQNLIGEIFNEEEKELTNIYEGILKAVSFGKRTSTEITSYLFSRSIISKDSSSILPKYLGALVSMGILEKLKVIEKNRFYYFHQSPVLDLHYYLDTKYSYVDVDTPSRYVREAIGYKMPFHVEQFFRNLLAKHFGMQCGIINTKDVEIDIALLEFKKLGVVGEVKWKKHIDSKEISAIESKLGMFDCRKLLIIPTRDVLAREPKGIEVFDVKDILKLASKI